MTDGVSRKRPKRDVNRQNPEPAQVMAADGSEVERSVAEGRPLGGGDDAGGELGVEVVREGGLGLGAKGVARFLRAQAQLGAPAGTGHRFLRPGDRPRHGGRHARPAEVRRNAPLLRFGENREREREGFGGVRDRRRTRVERDDDARDGVAGVVGVNVFRPCGKRHAPNAEKEKKTQRFAGKTHAFNSLTGRRRVGLRRRHSIGRVGRASGEGA